MKLTQSVQTTHVFTLELNALEALVLKHLFSAVGTEGNPHYDIIYNAGMALPAYQGAPRILRMGGVREDYGPLESNFTDPTLAAEVKRLLEEQS